MPIRPVSQEGVNRVQKHLREQLRDPEVKNGAPVRRLSLPDHIEFMRRRYEVPPVPYRKGTRLLEIRREMKDADDVRAVKLVDEAVALFRELVVPEGRIRRALWRWWPNPFRYASDQEVGELLGFFSLCRTKSRVRHIA
jgi:hypothetical protein